MGAEEFQRKFIAMGGSRDGFCWRAEGEVKWILGAVFRGKGAVLGKVQSRNFKIVF